MKKDISKTILNEKEQNFCLNYVHTGNIKESAIKAGYINNPEKFGTSLLFEPKINFEIERLYEEKRKNLIYKACCGYERLAFGTISDVIKLLYLEDYSDVQLENMDLFNVSEIKKIKGGGIEIKFFDRLKALEKLENIRISNIDNEKSFYSALEKSAELFEPNN